MIIRNNDGGHGNNKMIVEPLTMGIKGMIRIRKVLTTARASIIP